MYIYYPDRVWSLASPTASEPLAVLPHPCYVYTVYFSTTDTGTDQLVFTGAYDNVIRVWSITSDSYKVHCLLIVSATIICVLFVVLHVVDV